VTSVRTDAAAARLDLSGNLVLANDAEVAGGGVTLYVAADTEIGDTSLPVPASAHVTMGGDLVADNAVVGEGGGIAVLLQAFGEATASASIDLATIADNTTAGGGAGIELQSLTGVNVVGTPVEGEALLTVSDSIIAGNVGGFGIGGVGSNPVLGALGTRNVHALVSLSNIFDNASGPIEPTLTSPTPPPTPPPVLTESGNIAVDPVFDTDGPDDQAGTVDDYAHGLCRRIGHVSTSSLADVNRDGIVDGVDILRIAVAFGAAPGAPRFLALADLDGDGLVDGDDLALAAADLSQSCP
jgi:hypothetical protein